MFTLLAMITYLTGFELFSFMVNEDVRAMCFGQMSFGPFKEIEDRKRQ